jgi:diguanylate cyclase (GGDEF)-like protein
MIDVTERKQAEERIYHMAHHDALTGLPNRVLIQDRINQLIAQARRNRNMVAVLFIDLDNFKQINDSLGHQTGDTVLNMVADRLRGCLREGDNIARLGGDEFVLTLPVRSAHHDVALVAQKVLDALNLSFVVDNRELHISCSIGVSLFPTDGKDAEALMRTADTAMYHAKEKGRNNYQFFTQELNTAVRQRMSLEIQLRQAWEQGEFVVYYQPQIDLQSGAIFSAEALLRWHRKGAQPISCAEFISVAEETGLIVPIGEWVLREACKQLGRWRSDGHPDLRIAVNLSARQFYQANFQDKIARILDETGTPVDALELEITESMLMKPHEEILTCLKRLNAMGVHLSVDDFGVGYSSLSYLQRFPVDALKIDRSFVNGINEDPNDTAIVAAILALAQSLHLKVVAEGVENPGQAEFLREHGCQAAQGFYYSKPLPLDRYSRLLRGGDHMPQRAH